MKSVVYLGEERIDTFFHDGQKMYLCLFVALFNIEFISELVERRVGEIIDSRVQHHVK